MLLNFQGFFFPANFGPKFSVFCLPLMLGPQEVGQQPYLPVFTALSCTHGSKGLPAQALCWPALLRAWASSFHVGVEQGCKYL